MVAGIERLLVQNAGAAEFWAQYCNLTPPSLSEAGAVDTIVSHPSDGRLTTSLVTRPQRRWTPLLQDERLYPSIDHFRGAADVTGDLQCGSCGRECHN